MAPDHHVNFDSNRHGVVIRDQSSYSNHIRAIPSSSDHRGSQRVKSTSAFSFQLQNWPRSLAALSPRSNIIDDHIYEVDLERDRYVHSTRACIWLAWCPKEFGSGARPATFPRYFCSVKRRMRITLLEWNNVVENAGGWCMRQLVPVYGWEAVSYEELVASPAPSRAARPAFTTPVYLQDPDECIRRPATIFPRTAKFSCLSFGELRGPNLSRLNTITRQLLISQQEPRRELKKPIYDLMHVQTSAGDVERGVLFATRLSLLFLEESSQLLRCRFQFWTLFMLFSFHFVPGWLNATGENTCP